MTMFDSIINEADAKFSLGGKASGVLSALLALMTDETRGGLKGFLERFNEVGLGDTASSWINSGANTAISNEQIESALGTDTLDSIANRAGTDYNTATSATAFMTPRVIDALTPDGVLLEDDHLLSTIGGYLTGGAAGFTAAETFDRIEASAATDTLNRPIIGDRLDAASFEGGIVGARTNDALNRVDDYPANNDSPLRWLIPLLLLGLLLVIGYSFCGKSSEPVKPLATNANTNKASLNSNVNASAKTVNSSFDLKADNGKYVASGVVPDEATKKQIADALTAQYGAGNVDFSGLKVEANAKPFNANWWTNFAALLPNLKDWKTGELSFVGNAITVANGLPQAAIDRLKTLFGTGWRLPVSVSSAEAVSKQANEEALQNLSEAKTIDQVVSALNASIINFASGSAAIPADAEPVLQKAAEVLKAQTEAAKIEIGGYTDSDGDAAANMKLSEDRANAVMNELVRLGVKKDMLSAKGYGASNPVAPNDTPDNKFKNRRIEYKVGAAQ
ncbi:MAG: OmpA family protein [Pyrinomonadaceae bacterium]